MSKNEVRCRDDTMPKSIEKRRRFEDDLEHARCCATILHNTSLHFGFWGLRKIVECSKINHPQSGFFFATVFGTVSFLPPKEDNFSIY